MLEFIQILKKRYQSVLAARILDQGQQIIYQSRVETLSLAESFLLKGQLITSLPQHPLQIAIIGPTQAGKSSISNLLLNRVVAGVSPLAGFTVHPQGFCHDIKEQQCGWIYRYFEHFERVRESDLTRDQTQCFSLTELDRAQSTTLPDCILWDTPDFDSIDAAGYQEGVLRTAALADVIVLVVSKEKYADQSVWEMMKLLAPLSQPSIIMVNKLAEQSQALVINSLQEKWRQARNDSFPEVVPLLFQDPSGLHELAENQRKPLKQLFKSVEKKVNRRSHKDHETQLLVSHWQNWVEPVKAEHRILKEWQKILEQSLKDALENYQRDYLNHPHHYETFQNALAELLTLLEIPGLASILVYTRNLITWPIKQIYKLSSGYKTSLSDSSQEVALLNQIGEHLLISVADKLLDKVDQEPEQALWWKELNGLMRKQRAYLLQTYQQAVKAYHRQFQQEIEATAHRLYHKLQEQPVVLNSLRATRLSTDAAAVALALKTGGIGLHDLIITPAMLSITSLLAESAIGSFVSRLQAELKQKQLETVKRQLFCENLTTLLSEMPAKMQQHAHFNIPEQQLQQIEKQLKEKRHGLQIL